MTIFKSELYIFKDIVLNLIPVLCIHKNILVFINFNLNYSNRKRKLKISLVSNGNL